MIIGIIPARKNSKRIKNKNIKLLNGKPLIEYTIIEAKKSKLLDQIIVSTDSPIIKKISGMNGINVSKLRSKKLSSENVKMLSVLKNALIVNNLRKKAKTIVLLQPTSPLRKVEHIDKAIKIFDQEKFCRPNFLRSKTCLCRASISNMYILMVYNRIFYQTNKILLIKKTPINM